MALDIIRLYIDALSEFFSLSDPAVAPSPGGTRIPSFVPQGSNSLSTAHYLGKILTELGEFVNDITAVDLSSEATSGLRNLLDIVRWKFQEVLCDSWLNGV
jgi:exocyst complex component 2